MAFRCLSGKWFLNQPFITAALPVIFCAGILPPYISCSKAGFNKITRTGKKMKPNGVRLFNIDEQE
ncbi:MAG: hypothetical protein DI538_23065 [Azospira oryzae]|nr:MAG: hypothetical protein DI538_23065 [Azospira oryzae]